MSSYRDLFMVHSQQIHLKLQFQPDQRLRKLQPRSYNTKLTLLNFIKETLNTWEEKEIPLTHTFKYACSM